MRNEPEKDILSIFPHLMCLNQNTRNPLPWILKKFTVALKSWEKYVRWKVHISNNREPETRQNARSFGSSMAEWQSLGCLDSSRRTTVNKHHLCGSLLFFCKQYKNVTSCLFMHTKRHKKQVNFYLFVIVGNCTLFLWFYQG